VVGVLAAGSGFGAFFLNVSLLRGLTRRLVGSRFFGTADVTGLGGFFGTAGVAGPASVPRTARVFRRTRVGILGGILGAVLEPLYAHVHLLLAAAALPRR
jgi:hypothetical protein